MLSYAKIRFSPPYLAGTPAHFFIMQRTLRLTLLFSVILLVGCSPAVSSKNPPSTYASGRWGEDSLIVNGVAYNSVGGYAQQDGLIYPIVLVFPREQHYYPVFVYTEQDVKTQIYQQEDWTTVSTYTTYRDRIVDISTPNHANEVEAGEIKIADVDSGYVYFLDESKIVFQKPIKEVGFNATDPKRVFSSSHLQPILEALIREHVQPQDTETEEQEE